MIQKQFLLKSIITIIKHQHFQYAIRKYSNINTFQMFSSEAIESLGISKRNFDAIIRNNPYLEKTSINQWERIFSIFTFQGFKPELCLNMVSLYPRILFKNNNFIETSIENWRNCQFGENHLIYLLSSQPHLLDVSNEEIKKRIPVFLQILLTRKNVVKFLENNPNVMLQNWSHLQDKLNYITKEMKIDTSEIYNSSALELSLNEIQCRHTFLLLLGVYKVRNPKASSQEPNRNPRLAEITDTNINTFAVNVAGVTAEEFEVFQQMFLNKQNDEDSDIF